MLYEFALLPNVIEEAITSPNISEQRELIQLLQRFRENAMLVDLADGSWYKHVQELVISTNFPYRSEITKLLIDLKDRHRIVAHGEKQSSAPIDWLCEAAKTITSCSIDGVFLTDTEFARLSTPSNCYIPFPSAPFNIAGLLVWQGKRTKSLCKCDADFRSALAGILRHAQRVDLVDPYFSCGQCRYQKTLDLCIDLLARGYTKCPRLVIHSEMNGYNSVKEWKEAWRSYFQGIRPPKPLTLRAFLWEQKNEDRFHNRYIFTDQGVGIIAGDGLDCHRPEKASSDNWQLMDLDAAGKEWEKFTSSPQYTKLGYVEVARC